MSFLKKLFRWFIPGVETTDDGREKWPSRTAYILAAMGGAVGFGNLLRYPSIAFRNNGLQWFIPYFISLFFVGIPILIMEICFGQAYRGGAVKAYGRLNPRTRGLGLSTVYIGYIVAVYFVVIMSWILTYFRNSFTSPLPWAEDSVAFYNDQVIRNPDPIKDGGIWSYPDLSMNWETFGWTMFTWVLVYLCIFKGVSLTGKVVYFTMLFPLALILILTIRSVTLSDAGDGIKLYVGSWSWKKLFGGNIWTDALVQIFFSIGIGFGYYTAYASYNSTHANAVQDAFIIACSNSFIEVFAGFGAFAVLGHLGRTSTTEKISSFQLGFLTYPAAIANLPGSNAWAVFFFLTLCLLGIDSAFAMVEGFITVIMDTTWGKRPPRTLLVAIVVGAAALFSIMYCTAFGQKLMDGVDIWITQATLVFSMWLQCAVVTSIYRYKDVVQQTGMKAFIVAQTTYFGSIILGMILGHAVHFWVGFGVYVGLLIIGTLVAAGISNTPEVIPPKPFHVHKFLSAFWWLTSYPGHQLMKDWNAVVAQGRNWSIPFLWAPLLRWFSAPFLAVNYSLAYNNFGARMKDPMEIFGFLVAHIGMIMVVVTIILPRSMDIFVPEEERDVYLKQYSTSPLVTLPAPDVGLKGDVENGDEVSEKEKVTDETHHTDIDVTTGSN